MPDTYRDHMNDSTPLNQKPADDVAATIGIGKVKRQLPKIERKWVVGGVLGLIVLILIVRSLGGPAGPSFIFADVTQGGLTVTVSATGTLQPRNQVDVGAEISGQIEKVVVDYNDRVKLGDTLAVMDTDNLRAKVLQARASLASARAKLEETRATALEAKTKAGRVRDLSVRGNASKQEMDAAEAADGRARASVASAEAQIAVATANLATDETNLAKAEIKSPINGVVLSRRVEPGQVVAATFQTPVLFQLAEDLTVMELIVDVDEADIGQVKESQEATFTVDAFPDRLFPATITQVRFAPKTAEGVVTYQALLAVENKDLLLRPGMTATAVITTAARGDSILVPNAALRFVPPMPVDGSGKAASGGPPGLFRIFGPPPFAEKAAAPVARQGANQRVWILDGGQPKPIDIKVGLTDGQNTEVVAGSLKAGQKLLVGLQRAVK